MLRSYHAKRNLLASVITLLLLALTPASVLAEDDGQDYVEEQYFIEDRYSEFDRFESFNRAVFKFNDRADRYIAKPIAKAYQFITPSFVDEGVTNFFNNLDDVETFVNSILQGKFHNSIVALNRVIYNTVFGLGGFIDVATSFGLVATEEDFGQTLGYWGYEESSYIILPILGPSTVRDFGGLVFDTLVSDPLEYVDDISTEESLALKALNLTDKRADLLAAENLLFDDDRYAFIRSAYYQNREYLIKDGEIEDPFAEDDYDYDDF